jgi:hypothetical protein
MVLKLTKLNTFYDCTFLRNIVQLTRYLHNNI